MAPLADRVIGRARTGLRQAELGRLVAEAQRRYAKADVAVVNPGSLRHDLPAGEVTSADLFDVHAYEHRLVKLQVRGAELRDLLERCVCVSDGGPVDGGRTYTVVANELIADSDGFSALRRARRLRRLGTDLEALVTEVRRRGVVG